MNPISAKELAERAPAAAKTVAGLLSASKKLKVFVSTKQTQGQRDGQAMGITCEQNYVALLSRKAYNGTHEERQPD